MSGAVRIGESVTRSNCFWPKVDHGHNRRERVGARIRATGKILRVTGLLDRQCRNVTVNVNGRGIRVVVVTTRHPSRQNSLARDGEGAERVSIRPRDGPIAHSWITGGGTPRAS